MIHRFNEFFPVDPLKAPEGTMARIVSDAHVQRLQRLLNETRGTVVFGGQVDAERKFIVPTVVRDVKTDDALMSECVTAGGVHFWLRGPRV